MTPTANPTVATPRGDYKTKERLWEKCRALCGSEDEVKAHDVHVQHESNFLIPFSTSMDDVQYRFLKREAELPGVSAEFMQLLSGALLRKEPEVKLPDDVPAGAQEWITNQFGVDGSPLSAFMLGVVREECTTTRGFIQVDYDEETSLPFAVPHPAESVINWRKNKTELIQLVMLAEELLDTEYEFHPNYVPVVYVHELVNDVYQIRKFVQLYDDKGSLKDAEWREAGPATVPLIAGKPFDYIPIWPSNGEIEPEDPMMITIVNKEIALYNKIARRNHLLYGAATYTPYVSGVTDAAAFKKITEAGLGSWLHLPDKDAKLDVLKTPTEALVDLDRAIVDAYEELAKLGVRMLSPETAQSGVALQLRNASQTARLGTLNTRVSVIMTQVIATMLNWRYGTDYTAEQIEFKMQDDFANTIQGADWMRLATEWYENGHIPRDVWIKLLKKNDVLETDYDDVQGMKDIQVETERFKKYSDTLGGDNGDTI